MIAWDGMASFSLPLLQASLSFQSQGLEMRVDTKLERHLGHPACRQPNWDPKAFSPQCMNQTIAVPVIHTRTRLAIEVHNQVLVGHTTASLKIGGQSHSVRVSPKTHQHTYKRRLTRRRSPGRSSEPDVLPHRARHLLHKISQAAATSKLCTATIASLSYFTTRVLTGSLLLDSRCVHKPIQRPTSGLSQWLELRVFRGESSFLGDL